MEQNTKSAKTMSEVMEDLAQKNFGGHDLVMYAYREAQKNHDIWMEMINTYKESREMFNEDQSFLNAGYLGIFHYFNLYGKDYDGLVNGAIADLQRIEFQLWDVEDSEDFLPRLAVIGDGIAAVYNLKLEYRR